MNKKIGRNDPCPCGSGKKFKKCCLHLSSLKPASKPTPNRKSSSWSWCDKEGLHHVGKGIKPSPEDLAEMTKVIHKKIKNSPLWDEMVEEHGEAKANELLNECQCNLKS